MASQRLWKALCVTPHSPVIIVDPVAALLQTQTGSRSGGDVRIVTGEDSCIWVAREVVRTSGGSNELPVLCLLITIGKA